MRVTFGRWRAVVAGFAFSALACGLPEEGIEPYSFEPYQGEAVAAELGTLHVPENRARPDSRRIALRFVRFRSTAERPASPIVYLAGGPGGSGIRAAQGPRFDLFMALREFADVIAFDQRGTGWTGFEELDCDDRYQVPMEKAADRAEAAAIIGEITKDCMDRKRRKGIDVGAYNTLESAADLMSLREFLGAEQLTLWGISYGTHLALATMKEHGERVDRVILAGLEGLHHTLKLPSDQQALLEEVSRLASEDAKVGAVLPDLVGSIRSLRSDLERRPRRVRLTHPTRGGEIEIELGVFDLQAVLVNLLRGPSTFSRLPDLVFRLEQGDWTALALESGRRRSGEGIHSMTAAMDCASGASRSWKERIAAEARTTLLGDAINFPFPEVCRDLEIPDLGDEFRAPFRSDIPALLISGTLDGRTPPGNAEELLPGLTRGRHLVIEGAGHGDPLFLSSPEILETMKTFLAGGPVETDRLEIAKPTFLEPRRVVEIPDEVLARYTGVYEVDEDAEYKITKAGDILYARRTRQWIVPLRPMSERTFFHEGRDTHLEFEVGEAGQATRLVVYAADGAAIESARRVE